MNSLEILHALHRLNVRYAAVYPADRLPRVWTRSTAIVANTDEHNRPERHWVPFTSTSMVPAHISIVTESRHTRINDFICDFDEIPPRIDGTPSSYKDFFRKHAVNIVACFFTICLLVSTLSNFFVFLPMIITKTRISVSGA
nr:PREDICTED: uncharacterized protein LOC105679277 [Linepithema humile]